MIKRIITTLFFVLGFTTSALADITTGKFSTAQIFDVQWSLSGSTLNTSGYNYLCNGNAGCNRMTSSDYAAIDTAGQYFSFFNSTTNPGTYGFALYNSDGSLNRVIFNTGSFTALGNDAIFYNGNGSWGTLITTSQGYNIGDSATFTAMDTSVDNNDLQNYTYASSTPLAAGQTAAPAGPVYTSLNSTITNVFPTSTNTPTGEEAVKAVDGDTNTKYLNFDRETAGFTVKLSTGRVVRALQFTTANDFELRDPTKFTLYGSNDGVTWTLIVQDQPITLPSGRGVTIDPVAVTNTTAYVYYFITFPELKSSSDPTCANPTTQQELLQCDSVQIAEVIFLMEDGDTVTSTDQGSGGVANPGPQVQVPLSSITQIQQAQKDAAFAITNGNNIDLTIIGNSNDVDIQQLSDGNYLLMYIQGNLNVVDVTQSGTNSDRNFADINIVGNSNNFTMVQQGDSEKTAFIDIDGDFGIYNITQQGSGEHFLNLKNLGDNATVTVLQEGLGNHSAIVDLENAGGNWNFSLTQSGDVSQLFSSPHNLSDNTVVGGICTSGTCNMTINQQ